MRLYGLALATAGALVLGACAGKDKATSDTTSATAATTPTDTSATSAAPGGAAAPAPEQGGKPATGTTHEVRMVMEGTTPKFVPADITVKAGDAIKFLNVSGGPHNVSFKPEDIPDDVENQLDANMPNQPGAKLGKMMGPLIIDTTGPNSSYTVSFAGIKPGKYPYHCTPHEVQGMKGTITVQ